MNKQTKTVLEMGNLLTSSCSRESKQLLKSSEVLPFLLAASQKSKVRPYCFDTQHGIHLATEYLKCIIIEFDSYFHSILIKSNSDVKELAAT